ncbi:MAG: ABC transporter permease [Dehalococcoidia bacterium]
MASAREAASVEALAGRLERPLWIEWPRAVYIFARRKPLGAFGGLIIIAMIFMAIITATPAAGLVAPYGYNQQNYDVLMEKPSRAHLFGTDRNGRDELSRVIYGARFSVFVGFGAIALAQAISATIGVISGYYGGKFDTFFQRLVDIIMSFPSLVLLISVMVILQDTFGRAPNRVLIELILAIGLLFAFASSRITRGAVIAMKNNVYMEAARAIGARDLRIITRYVLPNVFPVIIVIATVQLGFAILTEASASFLGYGVPPPFPAWGRILSEDRQDFQFAPWLSIAPGVAIMLVVYGFNMLGDGLRDVLDPRMRGSR